MKLAVAILCGLGIFAPGIQAADWHTTAEKLSQSVVFVEYDGGSCTGFIINSEWTRDKDHPDSDLVMSAAHCNGPGLFVDNEVATVLWKDSKHDLMIVQIDDTGRPAISVAKANPVQGQEVVSYGYGAALSKPMFRLAHVSIVDITIPDVDGGPFVMIDAGYVAGQSGGPVINADGEVVSIVQRANGLLGIGVGAEVIRDRAKKYLEKPKPAKP
jgi:hypothetical protein